MFRWRFRVQTLVLWWRFEHNQSHLSARIQQGLTTLILNMNPTKTEDAKIQIQRYPKTFKPAILKYTQAWVYEQPNLDTNNDKAGQSKSILATRKVKTCKLRKCHNYCNRSSDQAAALQSHIKTSEAFKELWDVMTTTSHKNIFSDAGTENRDSVPQLLTWLIACGGLRETPNLREV